VAMYSPVRRSFNNHYSELIIALAGSTMDLMVVSLLGGDFKVIPELLVRQQSLEVVWDDVNSPTYANFLDKDILLTNLEVESNWRRAYEVINTVK